MNETTTNAAAWVAIEEAARYGRECAEMQTEEVIDLVAEDEE